MYLWRCVMTDEQEIIPLEYERKLSYLLRHHKELQPQILSWATRMLTEARKDWADMRATSIERIKITDAPVIFTANGEVLLMSKLA